MANKSPVLPTNLGPITRDATPEMEELTNRLLQSFNPTQAEVLIDLVGGIMQSALKKRDARITELEQKVARIEQVNKVFSRERVFNRTVEPQTIGFGDD